MIHTPNVSATKWWIGGAAQTATHSAVFAQLLIKGVGYGTKTFIVPLRNPAFVCVLRLVRTKLICVRRTFQLLPGIAIGDIGKKMGRDGIDNGWM